MWIARRYRGAKAWYNRRSWRTHLVLGAVFFTSPCWCGCGGLYLRGVALFWLDWTAEDRAYYREPSYGGGQPSHARKWKAVIESIPNPETAIREHPEFKVTRFPNGEWTFGMWISSIGLHQGKGTVVLKDSRGAVKVFFGLVCCWNVPEEIMSERPQTLDDFYQKMLANSIYQFREWVPSP